MLCSLGSPGGTRADAVGEGEGLVSHGKGGLLGLREVVRYGGCGYVPLGSLIGYHMVPSSYCRPRYRARRGQRGSVGVLRNPS